MNNFLVSIGILSLGLIICLFLVFRVKKKANGISHYEDMRDKLSIKEEEREELKKEIDDEEYINNFSLGRLIRGFITLILGFSMISPINNAVNETISTANIPFSTATISLLNWIPIFFSLSIVITAIGIIAPMFRK